MSKALIVYGGWDGHQPKECAEVCRKFLAADGFSVEVSDTLDAFKDEAKLLGLDLIVPIWTMGKLTGEQGGPVFKAVASGVGIAGFHGGMGDAFRENCEWQLMTGGQFVAHPGNKIKYPVYIKDPTHPITHGLKDFVVESEQYYMHVDPSNRVLASTTLPTAGGEGPHSPNGFFEQPQIWTRMYGKGRVFYSAIGHDAEVLVQEPHLTIIKRGFKWAAEGKGKA